MKQNPNILVTGSKGQLGRSIRHISPLSNAQITFVYQSSSELDITDQEGLLEHFSKNNYDYCINCAAYTNVDAAESNVEKTDKVNVHGIKNLTLACKKFSVTLIQISTDFVFDGSKSVPYTEMDTPDPVGIYGRSKLLGEKVIAEHLTDYYIIRTSWLYSQFGHNFMRSMVRLGQERDTLSVVFDQVGTPTYAIDLAESIVQIILRKDLDYGIYHYSNEGVASWYDFAKAIFELMKIDIDLKPIRSSAYPLPAKRPSYSVLDKEKIKENLQIRIPHWRDSLKQAIMALGTPMNNKNSHTESILIKDSSSMS